MFRFKKKPAVPMNTTREMNFPKTEKDLPGAIKELRGYLEFATRDCSTCITHDHTAIYPLIVEVTVPKYPRVELVVAHTTEKLVCYFLSRAVIFRNYGAEAVEIFWKYGLADPQLVVKICDKDAEATHRLLVKTFGVSVEAPNREKLANEMRAYSPTAAA